jgi:hypothetical protein
MFFKQLSASNGAGPVLTAVAGLLSPLKTKTNPSHLLRGWS